MSLSPKHILLFADHVGNYSTHMQRLYLLARSSHRLANFLSHTSQTLTQQINLLTKKEKDALGGWSELLELSQRHATHRDSRIGVVLTIAIQIGDLILLAEDDSSVLALAPHRSISFGIGFGLLSACVATAAQNADDVLTFGLETVKVGFELALRLYRRAKMIEDTEGPWAATITHTNLDELEERLDVFNKRIQAPLRQVFAVINTSEWSVVTGPLATLRELSQDETFAGTVQLCDKRPLALAHLSHLPMIDIKDMMEDRFCFPSCPLANPIFSLKTCKPFESPDLQTAIQHAATEIAHHKQWVEKSWDGLCTQLQPCAKPRVVSIGGQSAYTNLLKSRLPGRPDKDILQDDDATPQALREDANPKDLDNDSIAIVGMAGRFPATDDIDEFWKLLQTGKTTHQEIPASRFAIDDFYSPDGTKTTTKTRMGSFLRQPGQFDHGFFNISPREAMQMDPLQRLLLMATYEALETAGFTKMAIGSTKDLSNSDHVGSAPRVATYFGQTADDWKTINEQQGIGTHYVPSVNRAFAPGRLNHYFGWQGPTYSVDTACSSSASCICLARSGLLNGECDVAVVAGGSLLSGPEWFAGLSHGGFLSPNGPCKPFAEAADGYCRAEGVGVVVLKRLADARSDNDHVLGVLRAAERNSNAGDGSITHPSVSAQRSLYRRLLFKAGLQAGDVDFVEMHGTGTQAGDPVEMNAVWSVFGQDRVAPLPIGAVKACVGHSEAAAGITSLIKALLVLQHEHIPTQPGWPFPVNHRFAELLGKDLSISDGKPLPRGTRARNIMVNSFDAAGGNVSMLLQDAPSTMSSSSTEAPEGRAELRTHHVVICSGRSKSAHEANCLRLREYLHQHPQTPLADLAYTTTARRVMHPYRSAFAVSSISDLVTQLDSVPPSTSPAGKDTTPVVFAFTGQGSEYAGMGARLYNTISTIRELLDSFQALSLSQNPHQPPFIDVIRDDSFEMDAATPIQIQLAVVALELALAKYLQSIGIEPSLVVGHSLGEYSALCIAGVLSVTDTLYLVHARARILQDKATPSAYAMLSLPLSSDETREILGSSQLKNHCEIACINAPRMTVIGGKAEDVSALEKYLASQRIEGIRLRNQFAFHTSQMDPLLDDFEQAASLVAFREPKITVASTLVGEVVQERHVFNGTYLRRQMREPVNFVQAIRAAESAGLLPTNTFFLEIGPHPTCGAFATASCLGQEPIVPHAVLRRNRHDWEMLSNSLATASNLNVNVDWQHFYKPYIHSVRLIKLPAYAFDLRDFWAPYQTPSTDTQVHTSVESSQTKLSTSLHYLLSIEKSESCTTATYISHADDDELFACIQGHVIDGIPICSATIFTDMAYTAAANTISYAANELPTLPDMELIDMEMTSPFVVREKDPRLAVRTEAIFAPTEGKVRLHFKSNDGATSFGSCTIRLVDRKLPSDAAQAWKRAGGLIRERADSLEASAKSDNTTHHLRTDVIYRLFRDVFEYSHPYHGIANFTAPADFHDAAARYRLRSSDGIGTFTCNPFAIDAIIQVSGFLLNANIKNSKDEMYIANCIGKLRVFDDALPIERECRGYATVHERTPKGLCLCDAYVFDGERLVACINDIAFQKVRKDVFRMLIDTYASHDEPSVMRQPLSKTPSDRVVVAGQTGAKARSLRSDELIETLFMVMATQLGLGVDEIKEVSKASTLVEMGIDSQMGISIISDYKKRTGVELPAVVFVASSTFTEIENMLRLKYKLEHEGQGGNIAKRPQHSEGRERFAPKHSAVSISSRGSGPDMSAAQRLLQLTAEALGLSPEELSPDTDFATAGLDSMLSIGILFRFLKETGVELPASFFMQYLTVAQVTQALCHLSCSSESSPIDTPEDCAGQEDFVATSSEPSRSTSGTALGTLTAVPDSRNPESRAVLINGDPRSYDAPLFLMTDGSGTAESYIHLRPLPHGRRLYALESPFIHNHGGFTLALEEIAAIFVKSIREIQPHGPYFLGGWSVGGLYAYEAAHQLARANELIARLIIMDMRVPVSVPNERFNKAFTDLDVFRRRDRAGNFVSVLRPIQKEHFTSTLHAISKYQPVPFEESNRPLASFLIWATLGLDEREQSRGPPGELDNIVAAMGQTEESRDVSMMTLQQYEAYSRSWFYGKRQSFGTNGWEKLLGPDISVHKVEGDHFSIVTPPEVNDLSEMINKAIRGELAVHQQYS